MGSQWLDVCLPVKDWIKRAHLVTIGMDLQLVQRRSTQQQEQLHREYLVHTTQLARRRKRPWNLSRTKPQLKKVLQLFATHEEVQLESGESEAPELQLEEAHVELEDRSNEADDEDADIEKVMNAYMDEVAEFQTEDERNGIKEALDEAQRFLEIEKTTYEIELQEALEKEAEEVDEEKEKELRGEETMDVSKGAVLPGSDRTVTPMTSLFMHKSIEHLEIGRLSMRNNELVKFIETAEDEDDAKRYEDMLAEVEKKKQHQ